MILDVNNCIQEYLHHGKIPALPNGHFINGEIVPSLSGDLMSIADPGNGKDFMSVASARQPDVEIAISSARKGFNLWRDVAPAERGRVLARMASLMLRDIEYLAFAETITVGKTYKESYNNVRSAARTFEYYAGAPDKLHGDSIPLGVTQLGLTILEPLGVVAQIIPWNYPITTFARGVAPALAAGCSVIAKPAETTPLTALILAKLLCEAGLPKGTCNVLLGEGNVAGSGLSAHRDVAHVTFTGSPKVGTSVMMAAAEHYASVTLELGGKSPLIALADCNIEDAADGTIAAIYENAGQICSAGSRLIVDKRIHRVLVEAIKIRASRIQVGHGFRNNDMGAINSQQQLQRILGFLEQAANSGASVAFGGSRHFDAVDTGGWYIQPTLLDDLSVDHPCVQEEIFGPVLSVQVVDGSEEALIAVNATRYGLMAGIYTSDIGNALAMARDIKAGQVTINNYWGGGVEIPFGGVEQSGFGREKGLAAVASYCRTKSLVVKTLPRQISGL